MFHFTEINQTPSLYSMLQDVGREATPKLAATDCPKYLQTTLITGWGGLVSEFMWDIVGGISLDFAEILPRWNENFPNEHAQVGQPGMVR